MRKAILSIMNYVLSNEVHLTAKKQ